MHANIVSTKKVLELLLNLVKLKQNTEVLQPKPTNTHTYFTLLTRFNFEFENARFSFRVGRTKIVKGPRGVGYRCSKVPFSRLL